MNLIAQEHNISQISERIDALNFVPLCVCGPTASGKTSLAEKLALHLNGAILSADSMQIYRLLDIGTGKNDANRSTIPYYGLDIADPDEDYSVALYQSYARHSLLEMLNKGLYPVVCGGTGLYIRSIFDDMAYAEGDQTDNPFRDTYSALLREHGEKFLWNVLNERDEKSAAILHPNNARRVIRALELCDRGECYADRVEALHGVKQIIPAQFFAINVPRDVLYERIAARVDVMFESGLVQEVEHLVSLGFKESLTALQAIGYKEVVRYLDGLTSLDDCIAAIKQGTRRYAKRQISWFRTDKRVQWLDYRLSDEEKSIVILRSIGRESDIS